MRTSYTDAGVAVDDCSTLIDTELGMTREITTNTHVAVRIGGQIAANSLAAK
jgi:hypothetical protein